MAQAATKALSLASLVEWLEKQPADEHYDWTKAEECCIGQWIKASGTSVRNLFEKSNKLGMRDPYYDIAVKAYTSDRSLVLHTFGAALERAREALATPHPETSVSP